MHPYEELASVHAARKKKWCMTVLIAVLVVAIVATVFAFTSSSQTAEDTIADESSSSPSCAVFTFLAKTNTPVHEGGNQRTFNSVDYLSGSDITIGEEGDEIKLGVGTYMISASSNFQWLDLADTDADTNLTKPNYCELHVQESASTSTIVGNTPYAEHGVSSAVSTFLSVSSETVLTMNHIIEHTEDVWAGLDEYEQNQWGTISIVKLASTSPSYAVLSSSSEEPVPMDGWWNTVSWNNVEAHAGNDITLNSTRAVVLQPGTYWAHGYSTVMWADFSNASATYDPEYPPKGYCIAWTSEDVLFDPQDNETVGVTGAWASAVAGVPSVFDTIVVAEEEMELYVDHQDTEKNDGLYMNLGKGTISARMSVLRIPDDTSYSIISFFGDQDIPMVDGWNVRSFNTVDRTAGQDISIDIDSDATLIALKQGVYHITGFSLVFWTVYDDKYAIPQHHPRGQTQLVSKQSHQVLAVGTTASPLYEVPSEFSTILEVVEPMDIFVEHYVDYTNNTWLSLNKGNSTNHVYCRVSIVKLD